MRIVDPTADYKGFLDICGSYHFKEDVLSKALNHLKNWKALTESNFSEFLEVSTKYRTKKIDFEESLNQYKKWKDQDSKAKYSEYLKIVKEEQYKLAEIDKMLGQFSQYKATMKCSFPDYIVINKKYRGRVEFK